MNQTLECYLRCYINYQQDDWVDLLPSAEYSINNTISSSTEKTPFEMVYTFTPALSMNLARDPREDNLAAREKAGALKRGLLAGEEALASTTQSMSKYYDSKRKNMAYSVGDKVLLATRHIRTLRVSKKLADQFIGPFKVLERIGHNAYRLNLPAKYGKLHHTFHVSLLEEYHARDGVEPPAPVDIEGDEEWVVERILDERGGGKSKQYYVRWAGFSEAHDSWEPARHLLHAGDSLEAFKKEKEKRKATQNLIATSPARSRRTAPRKQAKTKAPAGASRSVEDRGLPGGASHHPNQPTM
jgi:hypothetical protein